MPELKVEGGILYWRFWLITGFTLLLLFLGYELHLWVSAQGWNLFIFNEHTRQGTLALHESGWWVLYYVWPFLLVGMGLGGWLLFYVGAFIGMKAAAQDMKARTQRVQEQQHQLQQQERALWQQRAQLQEAKEQTQRACQQQQAALAQRQTEVERYVASLRQTQADNETKVKAAYTERDQARQRAKRLQEDIQQLKNQRMANTELE